VILHNPTSIKPITPELQSNNKYNNNKQQFNYLPTNYQHQLSVPTIDDKSKQGEVYVLSKNTSSMGKTYVFIKKGK
jgi:hypothetical protein